MQKASAAEARLQTLTKTERVETESILPVQEACIQLVASYGSELWWELKEVDRSDNL
jgi:hypothetical protein